MSPAPPPMEPEISNPLSASPPNKDPVLPPSQSTPASPTGPARPPSVTGPYFAEKLGDAELLLSYSAELGLGVEDIVRDNVLKARSAYNAETMTQEIASNLLAALTALAVKVRPVTVESLKDWIESKGKGDRPTVRVYGISAFVVALLVLFISLVTFVSSRVSESLRTDVDTANGLAAKLALELGPPPPTNQVPAAASTAPLPRSASPDSAELVWFGSNGPPRGVSSKEVITDLQKFAATIRDVDRNSRQLNHFVFNAAYVPFSNLRTSWDDLKQKFELTPGLPLLLSREFTAKIQVYQEVRNFSNTVQGMTSVYYGAIATCILPVLYALLGAAAYLLRLYDDEVRNRTFVAGDKHVARFLIAGIGGLVVGQFNVTSSVAISPFAIAFLTGYAVDVFFAFLDGLLQMFKREPGNKAQPSPSPNPGR